MSREVTWCVDDIQRTIGEIVKCVGERADRLPVLVNDEEICSLDKKEVTREMAVRVVRVPRLQQCTRPAANEEAGFWEQRWVSEMIPMHMR